HRALAAGETSAVGKEGATRERPSEAAGGNTLTVKNLVVEAVDSSQGRISVATAKNQTGLSIDLPPGATATIKGVLADRLTTASGVKVEVPMGITATSAGVLADRLTTASGVKVNVPKGITATSAGVLADRLTAAAE